MVTCRVLHVHPSPCGQHRHPTQLCHSQTEGGVHLYDYGIREAGGGALPIVCDDSIQGAHHLVVQRLFVLYTLRTMYYVCTHIWDMPSRHVMFS